MAPTNPEEKGDDGGTTDYERARCGRALCHKRAGHKRAGGGHGTTDARWSPTYPAFATAGLAHRAALRVDDGLEGGFLLTKGVEEVATGTKRA